MLSDTAAAALELRSSSNPSPPSEAAPTSPITPEKKSVIMSDVRSADERNAMTGESMTRSTATEHMYFTALPPFFLSGSAAETIPARRNAHKISLI